MEHSIANQANYIISRFPAADTTSYALDLLGWQLSAQLGCKAVERLTARAVELEHELKAFVKGRSGISDCLLVEQEHGWDKPTAESFEWLRRDFEQTAKEAA